MQVVLSQKKIIDSISKGIKVRQLQRQMK